MGLSAKQAELIRGLRAGEESAFRQFFQDYGDKIYRLSMRYTRRPEDAEELVQEVLLTVFRKIHQFQGRSSLSTWVYAVTSNTALTFLRKKKNRPATYLEDTSLNEGNLSQVFRNGHQEWPEEIRDPVIRREINEVIEAAVEKLPDDYKRIYILKEFEKLPLKDIAAIFSLTVGAVKTRLHRARLLLRAELSDYFNSILGQQ